MNWFRERKVSTMNNIIIIMSCSQQGYPWPSLHVSLSFIASGRSSRLHPVSSHSCCMYVRAGRPAFEYRSTSLTSSSLLLQQCPACLVRLAWMVFVIGGRWPYSWCLVGCCCQDLFNMKLYYKISCCILILFHPATYENCHFNSVQY